MGLAMRRAGSQHIPCPCLLYYSTTDSPGCQTRIFIPAPPCPILSPLPWPSAYHQLMLPSSKVREGLEEFGSEAHVALEVQLVKGSSLPKCPLCCSPRRVYTWKDNDLPFSSCSPGTTIHLCIRRRDCFLPCNPQRYQFYLYIQYSAHILQAL